MRLLIIGLILVVIVATAMLAQEQKSSLRDLPYGELQRRLEGARSKSDWAGVEGVKNIANVMMEKSENDPEPHYWRAYALLHNNELEDALLGFNKVISLNKENVPPKYLEAYIGRAIVYYRRGQHSLAKEELLIAAGEGCSVREMQGFPELKDYLTDPGFFIKLVEKERVEASTPVDIFACPLKPRPDPLKPLPPPPPPPPPQPPDQLEKRKEMEKLCKEIGQDIAAGKNEDACEKFRKVKALYKDVLDGKITEEKIRKEMEDLWTQVRQEHLRELIKIEFGIFEKEANKLLEDLRGACGKRNLGDAEKYNAQLMTKLKEKLESTEPEFEPFIRIQKEYDAKREEMSKKYDAERKEIDKRWAILKEYIDEISPHIRLSATIIGQGVQSTAYLETRFGDKPVTHIMRENDRLLLPSGAEFTLTKIEDDKIVANYEKDVIKLKDGTTIKGKIVLESKEDITVRTKPDALVTIKRNEIDILKNNEIDILKYKEPVEKVMSRSFPVSSGSASGAEPKAP